MALEVALEARRLESSICPKVLRIWRQASRDGGFAHDYITQSHVSTISGLHAARSSLTLAQGQPTLQMRDLKAQSSQVICPRSHSRELGEPGPEPASDSEAGALSHSA